MRLTRAALRAEATTTPIETADASNLQTPSAERVPLAEVSLNAVAETVPEQDLEVKKMAPTKKTKAKAAKKGAKGKKGKKVEADAPEEIEQQQQVVQEDEREAAASPVTDAAVEDLAKAPAEDVVAQVPMNDARPASPPSRAVRMTRRQLAKAEEQLSRSQRMPEPPAQPDTLVAEEQIVNAPTLEPVEEPVEEPVAEVHEEEPVQEEPVAEIDIQEESAAEAQEEPVADTPEEEAAPVQPEPSVVAQEPEPEPSAPAPTISIPSSDPEPKTLTSSKPCEDSSASTPITSRAPSRSPSKSPAKTPMRLEQSIEAIDALEEALENINKTIPVFDHSADDKSPRKAQFDANARTATPNARSTAKVSRNPSAAPKSLKPTSHASKISAPRNSLMRSASTRVASTTRDADTKARKGSGEVVDYLAAKRRPISMSFPAPPPPVKSSKPPTKPAFQLPGEAIAAKIKAQREERLKREEEEAAARKAASFKARPAPVRKNVPAANMVRQTASSKARENLMNGKPVAGDKEKENRNAPGVSIPPPNPKRMSSINLASAPPATSTTTFTTTASKRLSTTLLSSSRPTCSSSTSHAPSSLSSSISLSNPIPGSKTTVSAAEQAAQRLKAREIFNRDKLEKEAREKERREKEDAAKRARAEAAERGRIASREWAERQKMKSKKFVAGKGEGEKVEQA